MHVPISDTELQALIGSAQNHSIPLTRTTDTHVDSSFAIDSTAADSEWSLAQLANLRLAAGLRMAEALNRALLAHADEPVNEPGDRGLTDSEAQRLTTIVSASFAACPPDATDADRIATVTAHVRGWLDTLT